MEMTGFEQLLDTQGYLCYTNVGISMMPLIREGKDVVLIRRGVPPYRRYDVVLFRRPDVEGRGKYVLHRILRVNRDGTYRIVGDNCTDGETVAESDILGVLTSVKRGKRQLSVGDFRYRLYVTVWCKPYRLRFFILRAKKRGIASLCSLRRKLRSLTNR